MSGQDMGASADADRATHEQSPQAVSAVPVGIPSAEQFADALYRVTMEPHREIAEELARELEASFTGDDADLHGFIGESHLLFGMGCAHRAADDLAQMRAGFDLRWKADMRAIKRWQEAHPGNDLVWPDHTDLVVWLLEQHDAQGMSTGTAKTPQGAEGRSPASPVPEGDAPEEDRND